VERKPEIKTVSLRTETTYKADAPGKVAQHTEAQGSGAEVNAEVAQLQFAFLSGETPEAQADRGVSRGHSTAEVKVGRPEPDRCHSTTDPQPAAQTPNGRAVALEELAGKHGETQVNLLEQILSRENMLLAWKRVKANKGAAGVDGMSTDAFPEFARQHWERIRSALEKGTYRPAAVLRVMIPKPTGGQRPLGIPTVLDRVIQQAMVNRVEEALQIAVYAEAQTFAVGLFHLSESHPRTALRPKAVAVSAEMRIEERSDDLGDCLLDHSIQHGWYSQRTLSSGGFWNHHPQHRCWAIGAPLKG
jgi:hypothetical protein